MDRLLAYLQEQAPRIDQALDGCLPRSEVPPALLHEAMRYMVLGKAKRMRPLLCLMSARACGGGEEGALPAACSLELVHTYSLIHDDLPAMDNDDMRRGRLTCHKAFDEANAILAGDALLTLAFEHLAASYSGDQAREMVLALARAAGHAGMVGGQVLDLEGEKQEPTLKLVQGIHARKTGALIACACRLGALSAGAGAEELAALGAYGEALGLLYQIVDDVLDVESTREQLGKTPGKDAASHKATYPAVLGLDAARDAARKQAAAAKKALEPLGKEALLMRLLSDYLVERQA